MKLYRFIASDTSKAIQNVHDALGPEALVYSTRKIPDGIEILAGDPYSKDDIEMVETHKGQLVSVKPEKTVNKGKVQVQNSSIDHKIIESLKTQMQSVNENIQKLSGHVNELNKMMAENSKKKATSKWSFIRNFSIRKFIKEGTYGQQTT